MTSPGEAVATHAAGRIGPNALTRTYEAAIATEGRNAADRLLASAGLERYLAVSPQAMIDENEVTELMSCVETSVGRSRARTIGWIGGQRTGDYLLANRIPRAAQFVLRALPAALASRLLVSAIRQHTWTFAGTGSVTFRTGNPTRIAIAACPLCRKIKSMKPACDFYASTFERLFAALVHPQATAVETACIAMGARECRFEIRWPAAHSSRFAGRRPVH